MSGVQDEANGMSAIRTAQDFVRALKAPNDPPSAALPAKVQIARQAWHDKAFHVPNKPELIVDWLLSRFQKERNQRSVILDVDAWRLLHDVCTQTPKSALASVLSRAHVATTLISALHALSDCPSEPRSAFLAVLQPTLANIWPTVSAKLSCEVLLDLFGHSLHVAAEGPSDDVYTIALQISASFVASLIHASNKKKIYITFLDTYLGDWLQLVNDIHDESSRAYLAAGVEILFNPDILKQANTDTADSHLFTALSKQNPSLVLSALPPLFDAFVSAINDSRNTIFSQGSSATANAAVDKQRAAGMSFYLACEKLLQSGEPATAWRSRGDLLAIVEKERLVTPDTEPALREVAEAAILAVSRRDAESPLDNAMRVLSTICRMDYDLLAPYVDRLLPLMVTLPTTPATSDLLTILLDYHSKIRTLDAHITALTTALLSADLTPPSSTPPDDAHTYRTCHASPLLHAAHLDRLAAATATFATPSQLAPQLAAAHARLAAAWGAHHARAPEPASPDGPRKRRRLDPARDRATRLALLCALLAAVVPALPARLLPPAQLEEFEAQVGALRELVGTVVKKAAREVRKGEEGARWAAEVALAAGLRFGYALEVGRGARLVVKAKLAAELLGIAEEGRTRPELVLEIFRCLLLEIDRGAEVDAHRVHESILGYLIAHLPGPSVAWDGYHHHLDTSNAHPQNALAILHMLLQRWSHVVDSTASPAQLERLAAILMGIEISTEADQDFAGITAQSLILQAMRSAQFWEMPNLRPAVFAYLSTALSAQSQKALPQTVACFHKLLYFPTDYLSRSFRAEVIAKAVQTDIVTCDAGDEESRTRNLTATRVFLGRTFASLGSVDQAPDTVVDHLLKMLVARVPCEDSTYADASLDLVEIYFSTLLKSTDAMAVKGCTKIVQALAKFKPTQPSRDLLGFALIRVVDILKRGFIAASTHEAVRSALSSLMDKLQSTLHKQVAAAADSVPERPSIHVLAVWTSLISLGKWLGTNFSEEALVFGQPLAQKVASLSSDVEGWTIAASASLSLLWIELSCVADAGRRGRLDLALASYVLYVSRSREADVNELDGCVSASVKTLTPEDYGYVLSLVSEALEGARVASTMTLPLLHVARVLLNNYPQNSLKHTQTFASLCISIFNNHTAFLSGTPDIVLEVLRFVADYCSDRPAALRQSDIPIIFTLLSNYLRPSTAHATTTSPAIFHAITTITGALVRLRRDLVTATLPHFTFVLRQLLFAIRRPRPQLGKRQAASLAASLPSWIAPTAPLGAAEAAALARALEALTAKTIPRTHRAEPPPRAESLAKAGARHAAPVLAAYADALNDPLCAMPADVRRALRPGLFALCEMLNEHTRDALMAAALDAAGKAAMKALWREYEKQKYVGRG